MQVTASTPNTNREMVYKWNMLEFLNQIQYIQDIAKVEEFNRIRDAARR